MESWKISCKIKKIFILGLIVNLIHAPIFALEFDTSIDDEIRKNYNPSKIEDDTALPALPKILEDDLTPPQKASPTYATRKNQNAVVSESLQYSQIKKNLTNKAQKDGIRLKKGTKIRLKLVNNVSDTSKRGTRLTFVSTHPVTTTYFTIPSGTIFKGEVINSHGPQFAGNGGLIVIKINSVTINGELQPINANVIRTNSKFIYLNNIKGKRTYAKSMFTSMKPGYHFFKKMMGVTRNLAIDGSSILISPFSLCAGVLGLGGNILVSPVMAIFHKGKSVSIKSGSEFKVKLMQEVYIYN